MSNPGTVLIADDESFIRKLTSRILIGEGFNILQGENGQQAMEIFDSHKDEISLAILDIRMPDMSGVDVFSHLFSQKPHVRVILCSGYGTDDVPPESADYFIQKPFAIKDFINTVQRVLSKSDEEVVENNKRVLKFSRNEE